MADAKPKTDTALIREFFYQKTPIAQITADLKKLSAEEKKTLADGIRSGTLKY